MIHLKLIRTNNVTKDQDPIFKVDGGLYTRYICAANQYVPNVGMMEILVWCSPNGKVLSHLDATKYDIVV